MRMGLRWTALGVLALAVGTLFQLYDQTGVGFFRMFGTLGVGVMGFVAATTFSVLQIEGARRELGQTLAESAEFKAHRAPKDLFASFVRAEHVLVGEAGSLLVATSAVPNFRGRRYLRRVALAADRVAEWARAMSTDAAAPVRPVLVLLRRRAGDAEKAIGDELGVQVVNPEEANAVRLAAQEGVSYSKEGSDTPSIIHDGH